MNPSLSSSSFDFDFIIGKWIVHNRKLKKRLVDHNEWQEFDATQEAHKILNGLGNSDIMRTTLDGSLFEGFTLRLLNPKTKLWSIYWADSVNATLDVPVMGSFEKEIGTFFTTDVFEGKNILVQFRWDKSNPDHPVWSQAFSPDNGVTWEWNWYMYFERVG